MPTPPSTAAGTVGAKQGRSGRQASADAPHLALPHQGAGERRPNAPLAFPPQHGEGGRRVSGGRVGSSFTTKQTSEILQERPPPVRSQGRSATLVSVFVRPGLDWSASRGAGGRRPRAIGDVARPPSGYNRRGALGSSPLSHPTEQSLDRNDRMDKAGYRDTDHLWSGCFRQMARCASRAHRAVQAF